MNKKVLLDTNIIIDREGNSTRINEAVFQLYKLIDQQKYTKIIHPVTIEELNSYYNSETRINLIKKLEAYEEIIPQEIQDKYFVDKIINSRINSNKNSQIDNSFLYQVFIGVSDWLITEDRSVHYKAQELGISNKVFTINSFIHFVKEHEPKIIKKEILSIKFKKFGNINLNDPFFDSLKKDYGEKEFTSWFHKKNTESAYVYENSEGLIDGFLYLKHEDENENYSNFIPTLSSKKRLKIGTLKIIRSGKRLGERFLQYIFENAVENKLDEIYVTIFDQDEDKKALVQLLKKWGFYKHGIKISNSSKEEAIYIKKINIYDETKTIKENYPLIKPEYKVFILPIENEFHNDLIPDSHYKKEAELILNLEGKANRNALQKVYISAGNPEKVKSGDLLLIYRKGENGTKKKYTSTLTTICIVDSIIFTNSKQKLIEESENRSIFSKEELEKMWPKYTKVVNFIYYKTLNIKIILEELYKLNIVESGAGPRPFHEITIEQFHEILKLSKTQI